MRAAGLARVVAALLVLASCTPSLDSGASPSAGRTADIRRARLDIA